MRLLLVEDDIDFAAFLSRGLTASDHQVKIARDGRDALFLVADEPFDAMILDRGLPLIDGLSVLKRLRNDRHAIPVIMLTSLGTLADKIDGFEAGADDYVVKPVAIAELNARLHAIARRPAAMAETGVLRTRTLKVDMIQRSVRRGDRDIELPALEFRVLAELLQNADRVVTRQMLLSAVWGYDFEPTTNIVASHIARLRAKLNVDDHVDAIKTVHGAGYVIYNDV